MSEVRRGYKQTEVGVIPEDWDVLAVNGLASRARNAIVGGPFGSDLVSKDYADDGVPVIRGQNMGGKWITGSFVFVSPKKAKALEANLAHEGDLVFTQRGTLGQVSLVPDEPFDSYLVSQSQMKVSVDRGIASPTFYLHVFTSEQQQAAIREGTIQTGVPHINLSILRGIKVPKPSLAEQEAIAEALSDADALIESLEQLLTKKRQLKQGAMQELLTGKKRLPGFQSRTGYKQTEIGLIPEDWEVRRLGTLGAVLTGHTPSTRDVANYGDEFLFVSPVDMGSSKCVSRTEKMLSRRGYAIARHFPAGAVLFVCIGSTIGKCGIAPIELTSNQQINAVVPSETVKTDFLYYALCCAAERIRVLAGEQAVPIVNKTQFSETEIVLPTLPEQTAIATVISDMDADVAALEAKLAKARQLKQGMMQELLTGRIRLV